MTLAAAALGAVLLWWAATGLIARLDHLPRRTFPLSLAGASLLGVAGLVGLDWSAERTDAIGAGVAFVSALAVWGWAEAAFLLGYVTGPRRAACPPGAVGLRRFRAAFAALAHHEAMLLALGLAVAAIAWDAANPVGLAAFAVLWAMRVSAKLNLFLGVRNPGTEFLPPHLAHLASYFRARTLNPLFPASAALGAVATALLAEAALAEPDAGLACGLALVAALTALGWIEHWLMVLPVSPAALWRWALPARAPAPDLAPSDWRRP